MFNVSYRRVGGIRFLKIGRLVITLCVSRRYHAIRMPLVDAFKTYN